MEFIIETMFEVGEAWVWLGFILVVKALQYCGVHHKGGK